VVGFFPSYCVCERSDKLHIIYELLQILDFYMASAPHKCLVGERRIAGMFCFPILHFPQMYPGYLTWLCGSLWQSEDFGQVNWWEVLWERSAGCVLS